jgi:5-methylcytosine-specific restriction endonuclease McrA
LAPGGEGPDYAAYIASHRWRTNAARVRELAVAQGKCRLCAEQGPLEVHHRDYENLGDERDGDLVALCARCHREVTSFLRRARYRPRTPRRADIPLLRDVRRPLVDPTR